MKLWKGNQLAGEYELDEAIMCSRFMSSPYYMVDCLEGIPISRALLNFIAAPESDGGLNSSFDVDDPAFMRVLDLVLDRLGDEQRPRRGTMWAKSSEAAEREHR